MWISCKPGRGRAAVFRPPIHDLRLFGYLRHQSLGVRVSTIGALLDPILFRGGDLGTKHENVKISDCLECWGILKRQKKATKKESGPEYGDATGPCKP